MNSTRDEIVARDQRNREKLIETATALFHLRGFQPTSLDEVFDRSRGVCRSNFYYYFRSKEDLGLEVLGRQIEAFADRVIRGILEDTRLSPRERVARLFETVISEMRNGSYRGGCPFGTWSPRCAEPIRSSGPSSAFFERWQEAVERCLAEGVGRGEFRADLDARGVAIALVGEIEGAVLLAKAHGHGAPIEAGAQAMLMLLESR